VAKVVLNGALLPPRAEAEVKDCTMNYRYDFVPTPFGEAVAVFSDEGIIRFELTSPNLPPSWALDHISRLLRAVPIRDAGAADSLAHLVDAYFNGEPIDFRDHVALDWSMVSGFAKDALQVINNITYGETLSYGEVAALAGSDRAARAVGTACRLTPFTVIVPVHRVVRSDGSPGEYGDHPERKRYLLSLESENAVSLKDA
jgi:methylated-DNA-[protein]-cysteine S-methyltransferase